MTSRLDLRHSHQASHGVPRTPEESRRAPHSPTARALVVSYSPLRCLPIFQNYEGSRLKFIRDVAVTGTDACDRREVGEYVVSRARREAATIGSSRDHRLLRIAPSSPLAFCRCRRTCRIYSDGPSSMARNPEQIVIQRGRDVASGPPLLSPRAAGMRSHPSSGLTPWHPSCPLAASSASITLRSFWRV